VNGAVKVGGMKKTALAALLLSATCTFADTPVTVLGVSLGGKLPPIKACPFDTDTAKDICWISPPYVSKDGLRYGSAHLPKPDNRPAWAANVMFKLTVAKDGTLNEIVAESLDDKNKNVIAQSINTRFGLPIETTLNGPGNWPKARWAGEGIFIRLECVVRCTTVFQTATAKAAQEKYIEENQRKEAARPKAP
jgi:hypothetical protein